MRLKTLKKARNYINAIRQESFNEGRLENALIRNQLSELKKPDMMVNEHIKSSMTPASTSKERYASFVKSNLKHP